MGGVTPSEILAGGPTSCHSKKYHRLQRARGPTKWCGCDFHAAPTHRERLVIYCQTSSVSAAHATHCATNCTPCRPLLRAFSGWSLTPPPTPDAHRVHPQGPQGPAEHMTPEVSHPRKSRAESILFGAETCVLRARRRWCLPLQNRLGPMLTGLYYGLGIISL